MPTFKPSGITKRGSKYGDAIATMSLRPSEIHIVLMAAVYQTPDGEPDFERIGEELHLAPASARRTYNGARTTIRQCLNAKDGENTARDEKPSRKGSGGPGGDDGASGGQAVA